MAEDRLHTVLVATDFSRTAERACEAAGLVARRHGARLVLLHALPIPMRIPSVAGGMPPPAPPPSGERAMAHHELGCRARRLREQGCQVEVAVGEGPAAEAILEAAAHWHADLIVCGTHGRTGVEQLLLGSVAGHVVRRSTVPVFTVHPRDARADEAPRSVLVPTDFSEDADTALLTAIRILGPPATDAGIILLHAVPRLRPHLGGEDTPEAARSRLEALAAAIEQRGHAVRVVVPDGNAAEAIVTEARRAGVELGAMDTHGRAGLARLLLGSTAEHVLPRAPCPVLTVRRSPGAAPGGRAEASA